MTVKLAMAIMVARRLSLDADGDDDSHDDDDDDEEDDGDAIAVDNNHGVDAMMTIMMMVTVMVVMVKSLTQTGVANVCYKSHALSYDAGAGKNVLPSCVRRSVR